MKSTEPSFLLRVREFAPVLRVAPLLPIRDDRDLATRLRNYRTSCKACPAGWQTYFEVLVAEMERQMPQ